MSAPPKQNHSPTEPPIRYTDVLRAARLQMSLIRASDSILPSSSSSSKITSKSNSNRNTINALGSWMEMDGFEMQNFDLDHDDNARVNNNNNNNDRSWWQLQAHSAP